MRRLLGEADRLYARADAGIARLPIACRPGIHAARSLYAAIGHEVARRGCDSVTARARVPGWRKARLLLQSAAGAALCRAAAPRPPLAANAFLVDAAASAPAAAPRGLGERVVWAFELLARSR